ncbi:MAG: acetyl-CoA carboxylase biotin carboxyl carrier protein [Parachlamydiales bacterium]
MNLDEIQKLMRLIEESKLSRFRLKKGDFELLLEKETARCQPVFSALPASSALSPTEISKNDKGQEEKSGIYVKSPMIGTYYAASSPDHLPFVKVGDVIDEEKVVCIVEAMKVMNEVKAGVRGVVKEIFCKNAQPVEFGTKLFRVE